MHVLAKPPKFSLTVLPVSKHWTYLAGLTCYQYCQLRANTVEPIYVPLLIKTKQRNEIILYNGGNNKH